MRFLDVALPKSYRAFHPANGGARNIRTAAMMKALGVKAGVADIVVIGEGGKAWMIEVKASKGSATPAQKDWNEWADANSVPFAICRSVGDVQVALNDWGVPLRAQVQA